jgi:L,D-transpeptidase ErfK/SrfK
MPVRLLILIILAIVWWPAAARAWYPRLDRDMILDPGNPAPVVGSNRPYLPAPGETLIELARRSGTGYQAMTRANPGIDPWLPPAGREIVLPYSFILPASTDEGITINLAELRLYYVWHENGQSRVRAYPVGIGREGWDTPLGNFTVVSRVKNPSWSAPASIRENSPGTPAMIPPGPNNPLGEFWLGLSVPGYGIHGTSKPLGVGRRVSHGCIRLYPEDIKDLFHRVSLDTPVWIIYQPVKVGLRDNRLYIEVHHSQTIREDDLLKEAMRHISTLDWQEPLDLAALHKAIWEQRGVPIPISLPENPAPGPD